MRKIGFLLIAFSLLLAACSNTNQKPPTKVPRSGPEVPTYVIWDHELYKVSTEGTNDLGEQLGITDGSWPIFKVKGIKDQDTLAVKFGSLCLLVRKSSFSDQDVRSHVFNPGNIANVFGLQGNISQYEFNDPSFSVTLSSGQSVSFTTSLLRLEAFKYDVTVTEKWDRGQHQWKFTITPTGDNFDGETGDDPPQKAIK